MDSDGEKPLWRKDLTEKLLSVQHGNGYWLNPNGRFQENIRELVTAYSVIAMKIALRGLLPGN